MSIPNLSRLEFYRHRRAIDFMLKCRSASYGDFTTVTSWRQKGMCQFTLASFVQVHRLEQQQLLRVLLQGRVDRIGRRPLTLSQPLDQLQQVNAAQRVGGSLDQATDTVCVEVSA